ncbi:hypothetical protein PV326_008245 [Microctonus aethiopoides]|nr:hypothetical protein PV326_008245 [Microctonus aethiopoides]
MPKFDDRFARQNRCEPPPEFPLASPYSSIVHHLSGPNSYALTQIHPKTSGSVDGAPRGTGRLQPLRQHPSRCADLSPGWSHYASPIRPPRGVVHDRGLYPTAQTDAGLPAEECPRRKPRAAFPNNSTRRRSFTRQRQAPTYGILTLCDVLFQGT